LNLYVTKMFRIDYMKLFGFMSIFYHKQPRSFPLQRASASKSEMNRFRTNGTASCMISGIEAMYMMKKEAVSKALGSDLTTQYIGHNVG
jgi:hypothetical protein